MLEKKHTPTHHHAQRPEWGYLDTAPVLVACHAVHLIHDEHMLAAHSLRGTWKKEARQFNVVKTSSSWHQGSGSSNQTI